MEKGYEYLQSLFDEEKYDALYRMIDTGRAHEPFEDRGGYETIFSESMFHRNVDVFRRIIQRDGTEIMHVPCAGREDTAWELLIYVFAMGRRVGGTTGIFLFGGSAVGRR